MRRALGFKLRPASGMLRDFASYLEHEGASHITVGTELMQGCCNVDAPGTTGPGFSDSLCLQAPAGRPVARPSPAGTLTTIEP